MDVILLTLMKCIAAIIIITVAGFSKAFASYRLGDKAVKNFGYLTLDPKKHFETLGFIFFVFFGYGWGNPIPTNTMYYDNNNKNKSTLITNLAPMLSAILIAFIALIGQNIILNSTSLRFSTIYTFFYTINYYAINFFILNLLPIYPFYGQEILQIILPSNISMWLYQNSKIIQIILLLLLLCGFLDPVFSILRIFIATILSFPLSFIF